MTTIEDNIMQMAEMVSKTKKRYMLSEQTVLRILDMTIALAREAASEMPTYPDDADVILAPEPEEYTIPTLVTIDEHSEEERND